MAGKTIGELSESVSLDNTNLLAVSSDGNVLKKTTLSTLENSLTASNFNATSKATIAGLAMPSSRYIDLTLGASGATYTAPANGYVFVHATIPSTGGYIYAWSMMHSITQAGVSNVTISNWIPVFEGQTFGVTYGNANIVTFRFIYSLGN